jgi:hypothetical protein
MYRQVIIIIIIIIIIIMVGDFNTPGFDWDPDCHYYSTPPHVYLTCSSASMLLEQQFA